jgi:hypothetical protein
LLNLQGRDHQTQEKQLKDSLTENSIKQSEMSEPHGLQLILLPRALDITAFKIYDLPKFKRFRIDSYTRALLKIVFYVTVAELSQQKS